MTTKQPTTSEEIVAAISQRVPPWHVSTETIAVPIGREVAVLEGEPPHPGVSCHPRAAGAGGFVVFLAKIRQSPE